MSYYMGHAQSGTPQSSQRVVAIISSISIIMII